MSSSSLISLEEGQNSSQEMPQKERSIQKCNFRVAGRMSNENARALTAMHETAAQNIAIALESYLGTAPEVKFATIAQQSAKDHIDEMRILCYVLPFSSGIVTLEIDLDLVFPMIELLMGGNGEARSAERELSEIEEEIMQDIALLMMRETTAVWALDGVSLVPEKRVKPSAVLQSLRPSEKVTILRFESVLGTASGAFNIVLSSPLCDLLIKKIKDEKPQKHSRVWSFPVPPLRERILDCDMDVVAELTDLKIAVRDLISLQPGSVLKLRAPIRASGMLTAGGRGLFEAVPVRSGSLRAAQLGRRTLLADWKRR